MRLRYAFGNVLSVARFVPRSPACRRMFAHELIVFHNIFAHWATSTSSLCFYDFYSVCTNGVSWRLFLRLPPLDVRAAFSQTKCPLQRLEKRICSHDQVGPPGVQATAKSTSVSKLRGCGSPPTSERLSTPVFLVHSLRARAPAEPWAPDQPPVGHPPVIQKNQWALLLLSFTPCHLVWTLSASKLVHPASFLGK